MKEKDAVKGGLDEAIDQELEDGEHVVAAAVGMVGSGVWGPTGMIAKWCYFAVTNRRVVVLSLSRWSYRVKGVWFSDALSDVEAGGNQTGELWSSFLYRRPDGTSLRVNYHRFWADDMTRVVRALGAPATAAS